MSYDTKFFDTFAQFISNKINVLKLCRVVSYSTSTKRASVQPMALKNNGNKRGLIQGALVLKHVEEDISVGKIVAVVFADGDFDNINGSNDYRLSSSRQHSVNDAVVVGVWDI